MHTSFSSGPVPLEGGMKLFVFIALRKYFTLDDINNYMSNVYRWKPGQRVPNIGKYILEGVGTPTPYALRPTPTPYAYALRPTPYAYAYAYAYASAGTRHWIAWNLHQEIK